MISELSRWTWQVTRWSDTKKTKEESTEQNTDLCWWPCMRQCSDIIWGTAGSRAWAGYCWCDAIWSQKDARFGVGVWTKGPFYSHYCSLSLSHTNAECQNHCCQSYWPCHTVTPSLFNSFFFSFYSSCSHFSSHPPFTSEPWVCHTVQNSEHGCDFQQGSNKSNKYDFL